MASAVARAYNGGLGAEPPAGSRAEPLVGVRGRSPLKLKAFCCETSKGSSKFGPFLGKSNHTFGFAGCHGLFQAIWSLYKVQLFWLLFRYNYFNLFCSCVNHITLWLCITCWLLNWLLCTEYDQSALQRRDVLKEIGRLYTRQEKTP